MQQFLPLDGGSRNARIDRRALVILFASIICSRCCISLGAKEREWPSFLPPPSQVPNEGLVRQVWRNTTFKREVEAAPLEAPASVCGSIVDSPGILAAAASHLGLTNESAELKPDGSFELHSPDGSFAWYRVIWYEPQRRVIVSQGTLGISGFDVRAAVLGELQISTSDGPIPCNVLR